AASHVPSAPAALAATISSSALTASTAVTTAGFSFASAAMKTMFWLKLKLAALIIAACIVPITVAAVVLPHAPTTRTTTAPVYTFHGRLVDGKGAPVAGAKIEIWAEKGSASQRPKAISDADGSFNLSNSVTPKILLNVTKPGYREISIKEYDCSDALQPVTFLRLLTVTGNVTDAQTHQPIASFTVMPGGAWSQQQRFVERDRGVAARSGRYSLDFPWPYPQTWVHVEAP